MAKLVIWNTDLKNEYANLFKTCVVHSDKLPVIDRIVENLSKNEKRYQDVAKVVGCPWWVVGIIHYIECAFSFQKHLHNGDPLTDKTVRVPAGRPVTGKPPFAWAFSAVDALKLKRFDQVGEWSVERALFILEGYNGFGYRQYHPSVLTPYLWSFTNHYTAGKYTGDDHYDPACVSQQAGLAAILKRAVDRNVIILGKR